MYYSQVFTLTFGRDVTSKSSTWHVILANSKPFFGLHLEASKQKSTEFPQFHFCITPRISSHGMVKNLTHGQALTKMVMLKHRGNANTARSKKNV
jgi:hypothetical protein